MKKAKFVKFIFKNGVVTSREETKEEQKERLGRKEREKQKELLRQQEAVDLFCDKCGGVMGKVYENDLNGSKFYHTDCV